MALHHTSNSDMTLLQAKALLATQLRFGDERQIHAVRMLEMADEVLAAQEAEVKAKCQECDGEGQHCCSCGHEHECPECDGTGKVMRSVRMKDLEGMTAVQLTETLEDIHVGEAD